MENKKILKYSEADMQQALAAVSSGMAVSTASRTYKVPRTTLLYKHTGKYPLKRKMGPDTVLSEEEETALVRWMLYIAKAGFPATKNQLLDSVQLLLKETKKANPFVNNRSGRHWFENFHKRHPQLSMRQPTNICGSRGVLTEGQIRNWFKEVEDFLKSYGHLDVIKNGSRIFNMDETAFFLCPKGDKVIVKKGQKCIYSFNQNDEKECLTVLLGGNAVGLQTPPMVIFSYERIPAAVSLLLPANWSVGKSENGWMVSANFYEYMVNIFYPWVVSQNIEFPIIVFIDGHKSHLTMPLSDFCNEHGIILIALFPNATHIFQPMDVSIFRPLKSSWKKSVLEFRVENNGKKLKRENFASLLQKTVDRTLTSNMFVNGFRKCGIYPFDADAVDYSRLLRNVEPKEETGNTETIKCINFIEKKLGHKLQLFQNCQGGMWNGNIEDKALYEFWASLHDNINFGNSSAEAETNKTDPNDNIENQDWMYLDTLLNDNSIVECQIDGEGHLIVDINKGCDENANYKLSQQIPGTSSSNTKADVQTKDKSHTDLILYPKRCSTNHDINLPGHVSQNKDYTSNSERESVPEKPHALECRTPEKAPEVPGEVATHAGNEKPQFQVDPSVPSPFKRILFWPSSEMKNVKKRRKEKIPSVATSQQWKDYHTKKENEKKKLEEEKLERKRKREEKKQSLESVTKRKELQRKNFNKKKYLL